MYWIMGGVECPVDTRRVPGICMPIQATERTAGSRKRWGIAWFISLALHAWLIFPRVSALAPDPVAPPIAPPAIEVNLRSARQLVDTPPEDPDAPESLDTPYISERNARARDAVPGGEDRIHARIEDGQEIENAAGAGGRVAQAPGPRYLKRSQVGERPERGEAPGRMPSAETASPAVPAEAGGGPMGFATHPDLRITAEDANAAGEGALSLSTYAWNWVPYIRELKERIESNLNPPPAFWQLGIIEGEARLKFRILDDGTLVGPVLITSSGHESLDRASMQSVAVSVPFRPLPSDFPDEYLDIRCRYYYWLPDRRRSHRRPRKESR